MGNPAIKAILRAWLLLQGWPPSLVDRVAPWP
jgi:hypothetical protein